MTLRLSNIMLFVKDLARMRAFYESGLDLPFIGGGPFEAAPNASGERMVDDDTAEALKIITRSATQRMARFSAEYMRRLGRKRVTIGHKSNVLKLTDGLFLRSATEVLAGFADLTTGERLAVAPALVLMLVLGLVPQLVLGSVNGTVMHLLAGWRF